MSSRRPLLCSSCIPARGLRARFQGINPFSVLLPPLLVLEGRPRIAPGFNPEFFERPPAVFTRRTRSDQGHVRRRDRRCPLRRRGPRACPGTLQRPSGCYPSSPPRRCCAALSTISQRLSSERKGKVPLEEGTLARPWADTGVCPYAGSAPAGLGEPGGRQW
jgi:hypothetical protein